MAIRRIDPPWDYLHAASVPSLQSYELSRLNHASNLRREIGALIEQWIDDTSNALLARWLRQDRTVPEPASQLPQGLPQAELPFAEPLPAEQEHRRVGRSMKLPARRSRAAGDG